MDCEKKRNAENGSKMLENLKIQKTLYVIKNFNVANEQIWKKLFRKIICFGPWCINVDSIQFIMFLFLSFVQQIGLLSQICYSSVSTITETPHEIYFLFSQNFRHFKKHGIALLVSGN